MSVKTYLWIEDRIGKASYIFWTVFMQELCPNVIVEGKMNNRELVKAVKGLNDKENRYIIALDNSFDNVQVYMEQKILKEATEKRDNVFLLNLICFEYTLLEFNKLIEWIYASEDEFRKKRAVEHYGISPKKIEEFLHKQDKHRAHYHSFYTDQKWKAIENYDLTIDSSRFGVDASVEMIIAAAKIKSGI